MSDSQYLPQQLEALKNNIDHIVVLMLENRSFDNLLGWLYEDGAPNNQKFEGLNYSMWNPLDNIDANGNPFTEQVFIRKNGEDFKLGKKTVKCDKPDFTLPNPDPGEGFADTTFQLYGTYKVDADYPPLASNQGFVNNYKNAQLYGSYTYQDGVCDPREIMTCYQPTQVPVLSTLAQEYAVCDHWFCSVPSQTLTNRDFFHAAQSNGHVNNSPNGDCDANAVDVSGVLTLKTPRTDAKPITAPPAGKHVPSEVNDLHRIMAETLAKYTGKPMPSDDVLIKEMGAMYREHFNGKTPKS